MSVQQISVRSVAAFMVAIAGSACAYGSFTMHPPAQGQSSVKAVQGHDARIGHNERTSVSGVGLTADGAPAMGPNRGGLDCGSMNITQSGNPTLIQNGSVWCGTLAVSDENSFARAFEASTAIDIRCVTFGVRQCTGGDWPVRVRLRLGEIEDSYSSHAVVAESLLVIPSGTTSELIVVELGPVSLPAGTKYIVEIQYDSRDIADGGDGGLLTLGFNNQGQTAASYMRAPGCDLGEFVTVASTGFPNRHLVMTVSAEERVPAVVMGGFPFEAIGEATLGVVDGDIVVSGTPGMTFGVTTSFGQGVTGTESPPVRWNNRPGSQLTSIHRAGGLEQTLSLVGLTDDTMRLDVDFGTGGSELFDYVATDESGKVVAVLENQPSGTVQIQFIQRDINGLVDRRCWWVSTVPGREGLRCDLSLPGEVCKRVCTMAVMDATGRINISTHWDEFASVSITPSGGGPVEDWNPSAFGSVDLIGVNVDDFLIGSSINTGSLSFGDATVGHEVQGISGTWNAVGVLVSAQTNGADILLEGIIGSEGPELRRKRFDAFPFIDDVEFSLGGVESAQVDLSGFQWTGNVTTSPCLFFSALQVGGGSGGTVAFDPCVLCPPPQQTNEWTAVTGDFSGVGDGTFTFQAFSNGIMVYEQEGVNAASDIGAMSTWPSTLGKLGGDTPCIVAEYPGGTSVWLTAIDQTMACNEIRLLAEGTGGALPLLDSMTISSIGFAEMTFANFEAVLPVVPDPCTADLTGDGILDFFDVQLFLNLYASSNLAADFTGDGVLDFFDVQAFLNLYAAGCP